MLIKDLTSQRFGRLVAKEYTGSNKHGKALWRCVCDCGTVCIIVGSRLKSGNTRSCGCLFREGNHSSHKMTGSRPYIIWQNMVSRCTNPIRSHNDFKYYGGRGIQVCDEWKTFEGFWRDMASGYSDGLSVERIDNNGNYEPGNCKWATREEQANNRRANTKISFLGQTLSTSQWARFLGVTPGMLRLRLRRGWPPGAALTQGIFPLPLSEG